jgi:hypothetical protein
LLRRTHLPLSRLSFALQRATAAKQLPSSQCTSAKFLPSVRPPPLRSVGRCSASPHRIGNNAAATQPFFLSQRLLSRIHALGKRSAKKKCSLCGAFQAMPPPVAALLPRPKNPTRQHGLYPVLAVINVPQIPRCHRVVQCG